MKNIPVPCSNGKKYKHFRHVHFLSYTVSVFDFFRVQLFFFMKELNCPQFSVKIIIIS